MHSYDSQQEEIILIKSNYKIANHGYLTFLFLKNGKPFEKKAYTYDIDEKFGNVNIGFLKHDKVDSNFNLNDFSNSKQWNKKHIGTYREKIFSKIDKQFLFMSNEEKLSLMHSLSQNH